ncbi:MAG: sugar transferase [Propionibacteriaceae bacterium]|nr:sugar transferase [Propionibacteriaceae bacterium]
MYRHFTKRLLDMALSSVALVVLAPLMALIAVWVKVDSPGPVFFTQKRIGMNKKHFSMLKYRTMKTDAPHDTPTHLLADPEAHITRAGRVLRKLSLDELPQLYNVLQGEMSLVGPRPALWNQDDLIAAREASGANAMRPGLTGWAQIKGRDELSIERKAVFDGEYARKVQFRLDAMCLWYTVEKVIRGEGIVDGVADPVRLMR